MKGLKGLLFAEAVRNYRALTILFVFTVTLGLVSVERVSWKDGEIELHLRDASIESIAAGLVSATLVVDRDVKWIKTVVGKFLEK